MTGGNVLNQYTIAYAASWLNAAVGVVSGVLAGAALTVHPSWLTPDIAMTCGIIVPITVGLAALLPPVTRTPAKRESQLLTAYAGALPKDLAEKHNVPQA